MMNLTYKDKDFITIDERLRQLRYLENYKERGLIHFIELSNSDIEGYTYLFNEDKGLFMDTLKEDIKTFIGKNIITKHLKVM